MTLAEFHEKLTPEQLELSLYIDKLFLDIAGVSRKIRYRVPFYDYNKWICYLNPQSHNHFELCFLDGKALSKTHPELQIKGRKMVAGLLLDAKSDLDIPLILSIFDTARLQQEP